MMEKTVITSVEKVGERKFIVHLEVKNGADTKIVKKEVNTILMAIGRDPNPQSWGAKKAGVQIHSSSNKIVGRPGEIERTSVDHIYAVGDIVHGVPELMPVAQKSGKLLANRVYHRLNTLK